MLKVTFDIKFEQEHASKLFGVYFKFCEEKTSFSSYVKNHYSIIYKSIWKNILAKLTKFQAKLQRVKL